MKLKETITGHDTVTSRSENIQHKNLTVCVMQTGRKQENFNPFTTIDWMAYQGEPTHSEGLTGIIQVVGSFILHYLHNINIERKVLQQMITR